VALAARLHALEAERAAEKDAQARADLFAKRPDFSEAVRATLATAPLAMLANAVTTWPRASASPGAAAAALTPGVTGGERRSAYVPNLTAEEQAILAQFDKRPSGPKSAAIHGTSFVMPVGITQEEARARVEQLAKELES